VESENLDMQCSKAARQLQLYIDKRLTLEQIRALEFHLSMCSECREELFLLEEIEQALKGMEMVAEPADLTANIMRRVAVSSRMQQSQRSFAEEQESFSLFRPSFGEFLSAIALATMAMLGLVLEQLAVRGAVELQSPLNSLWTIFWTMVSALNNQTFMTVLWILGTLLGVWITLIVAGADMRNQWFKAVLDRLPVH
jgi:anti-sigma factor RsiW